MLSPGLFTSRLCLLRPRVMQPRYFLIFCKQSKNVHIRGGSRIDTWWTPCDFCLWLPIDTETSLSCNKDLNRLSAGFLVWPSVSLFSLSIDEALLRGFNNTEIYIYHVSWLKASIWKICMRSVAQSLVNFTQELSVLNRGLIKTLYFDPLQL